MAIIHYQCRVAVSAPAFFKRPESIEDGISIGFWGRQRAELISRGRHPSLPRFSNPGLYEFDRSRPITPPRVGSVEAILL